MKVRWSRWLQVVLLASVIIALTATALAESEITITPIKNQLTSSEEALFALKITNKADVKQKYSIYSFQNGQGWNVNPSPLKDRIIEIDPRRSYTTTMKVQPLEAFLPGIYRVQVTVESDLGERHAEELKMYLGPDKPMDYLPAIKASVDMDEKIDPREPVSIKLALENRNPLNLKGLQIKIQSDIPEFEKEVEVDLPPLEKKTVEFMVVPSPYQQPKDYVLFFVFQREGQTVKILEQRMEIISLEIPFKTEVQTESKFLKQFHTVKITNEGNVLNTQKVSLPVTFWEVLLSAHKGSIVKEGTQRYLRWELSVSPNESKSIEYVTNYRWLLYLAGLLLLFGLFYLYVRSPVKVIKKAATLKREEEALSGIKITLEIRNKSSQPLSEVKVIDLVPGIADVESSLEVGTLQPEEIQHTKRGTKVIWSLTELEGKEHRLITYRVKAKLNILGAFSLPRAVVEYKKRGRHRRKAYSNICRLGE